VERQRAEGRSHQTLTLISLLAFLLLRVDVEVGGVADLVHPRGPLVHVLGAQRVDVVDVRQVEDRLVRGDILRQARQRLVQEDRLRAHETV